MEGVILTLKLDMAGPPLQTVLRVKQCDKNSRFILIELFANKKPWKLPTVCEVYIYAVKPDGKVVFNGCQVIGDKVLAPLTEQMLAVDGGLKCELYIRVPDGNVKSQTFAVQVEKMLFDGEAIESTDEFGALEELLKQIQDVMEHGIKGDPGPQGPPGEKGDRGEPGLNGADGYTPVRGVDYWTADDIESVHAYIDEQLGGIANGYY